MADKLSQGTWTHDHPISLKEAHELGLPVRGEMPAEFYQLMALFPQPTQRQPSVQYIPGPYGPPPSQAGKDQLRRHGSASGTHRHKSPRCKTCRFCLISLLNKRI